MAWFVPLLWGIVGLGGVIAIKAIKAIKASSDDNGKPIEYKPGKHIVLLGESQAGKTEVANILRGIGFGGFI